MATDTSDWRILVDLPQKDPDLGFRDQAIAIKNIICNSHPRFAIGIFGPWGSGKTTLMNAVKDRLPGDICLTVDFSAWRYEKEDQLLIPLLDTLRDALLGSTQAGTLSPRLRQKATATAKTLGHILTALLAGTGIKAGISNAFEVSFDANKALTNYKEKRDAASIASQSSLEGVLAHPELSRSVYHTAFESLRKAFALLRDDDQRFRIVVFIDDLDRCQPANMIEIMEAMKLFFDLEGFVFVVGVDRAIAQAAIDSRYSAKDHPGRPFGVDYLKKIFQVPFNLPTIRRELLGTLLDTFHQDASFPEAQARLISGEVLRHLEHATREVTLNPRTIKRFVNDFSIQMMFRSSLEPGVVLTLITLQTRPDWLPVYDAILIEEIGFYDCLKRLVNGLANESEVDPSYPQIPFDLVQYLQTTGAPLLALEESDLIQYLNSAVSSSERSRAHELRSAGQLAAQFRNLVQKANDAATENKKKEFLIDAIGKARRLLSEFQGILGVGPTGTGNGPLKPLEDFIESHQRATSEINEATAKEAEKIGTNIRELLELVRRRLS